MKFILEKTSLGDRKSVKQEAYLAHCYVQSDGLAACCICDEDYPRRPAYVMLSKVCEKISENQIIKTYKKNLFLF